MQIRKAREEDYSRMLAVYERARQFMRDTGNPNQWKDTDPRPEAVLEGIRSGKAYVAVSEGKAVLEEECFLLICNKPIPNLRLRQVELVSLLLLQLY